MSERRPPGNGDADAPAQGPSLADALQEALDPTVVLRRIVEQAMVLIPRAEGSAVEIASHDRLSYVCTSGHLAPFVGSELELGGSLSGLAVGQGRVLVCDDSSTDERVDREACMRTGIASMICAPLRRATGPIGVVKVTSSQPAAFGPGDAETLTRLSEFVTNAVSAAIETSRAVAAVLRRDQDGPGGCGDEAAIAEFIANVLHPGLAADRAARQRVESVLHDRAFDIVVQPIYDLTTGSMTSVEALSRFRTVPYVAPDVWFAEAQKAGLGPELELAALDAALETLDELPAGIRLALNASPQTIASEHLIALVDRCGPGRVVVELTEHLRVEDYPALTRRLEPLRREGAMLAVDDTGAGISSLTHILKLAPDIIKLDRYLTSGVDIDPVRRALAAALITFAGESGARIVAEGIETADELATLCALGVHYGQGYYLGRPGPARHLDLGPDAARRIAEGRAAASSRPGS